MVGGLTDLLYISPANGERAVPGTIPLSELLIFRCKESFYSLIITFPIDIFTAIEKMCAHTVSTFPKAYFTFKQ